MGGTFNPSAQNFKLYLMNDGTAKYGFGVNLGELAYIISDNFGDHVWYANGTEVLRVYNPNQTNNGSALFIEKGLKQNRTAVSDAAYSLLKTDYLIAYTSITASRAVTLPTAASVAGQHFVIKDESGSASGTIKITIVGTIDGASNPDAVITARGKYHFYSNGTAFFTE